MRVTTRTVAATTALLLAAVAGGAAVHAASDWPIVGGSAVVRLPTRGVALTAVSVTPALKVPGRPSPTEAAQRELFHSAHGGLAAGLFESSGGSLLLRKRPTDEVNYVVSGTLILHDRTNGTSTTFRPGDHFATTTGFDGVWEARGRLRVIYIVPAKAP